ncbi:hypothetical protein FHG87_010888 [Trinorchestia longiramus]|nr:hypothetical protein FHG87_010888 [Trinorchestia longiramus]
MRLTIKVYIPYDIDGHRGVLLHGVQGIYETIGENATIGRHSSHLNVRVRGGLGRLRTWWVGKAGDVVGWEGWGRGSELRNDKNASFSWLQCYHYLIFTSTASTSTASAASKSTASAASKSTASVSTSTASTFTVSTFSVSASRSAASVSTASVSTSTASISTASVSISTASTYTASTSTVSASTRCIITTSLFSKQRA